MNTIAQEAKAALEIAQKREKPITLVVNGLPIHFRTVTSVITEDDRSIMAHVCGVIQYELFPHGHKEVGHKVSIDLESVNAVIDRDHTNLGHNDL